MKTKGTFLWILGYFVLPMSIFAQGSLNPTTGPTPSMKSLDQIEPRTLINALPFTINAGGSYYLSKSLSVSSGNAITITVDNVFLDLNGFTISSTAAPAAGSAITLSGGRHNVRITNGNISGSVTFNGSSFSGAGFQNGIVGTTTDPATTTVSFLNVSGCTGAGIYLGLGTSATLVDACNVQNIGGYGIVAVSITNSTAANCGAAAITGHTVMNCRGDCVTNDVGISATIATNCYGKSTNNIGLSAINATNCYGANLLGNNNSTTVGLSASNAVGCYGASNQGTGMVADTAQNCEATTSGNSNNLGLSVKNAENCYATVPNGAGGAIAIYATGSILNCYGVSFNGIQANAAENCTGLATSGIPVQAQAAANCYGGPAGSAHIGVGIQAGTAFNCNGSGAIGVSGGIVSHSVGNALYGGTFGVAAQTLAFMCDGGLGNPASVSATHVYFCGSGPAIYPLASGF